MSLDFEDIITYKFIDLFNINLDITEEIIIDNNLFPNYCLINLCDIKELNGYRKFEYCRIINKIFGFDYNNTKLSYYEDKDLLITPKDIIFDCGANMGLFSLYAAYKGSKVYSFEPSPLMKNYLVNTQKYNNNIAIVQKALSSKNEKQLFNLLDNPGASRLDNIECPKYHEKLCKIWVDTITLDKFVEETNIIPTFIKMDVEGSELDILQGSLQIIQSYKPKLSISIHENNIKNIEDIKNQLKHYYNFKLKEADQYDPILLCIPRR